MRRKILHQSGAALAELSMCLVILLLAVMGTLNIGKAMDNNARAMHALHRAARAALFSSQPFTRAPEATGFEKCAALVISPPPVDIAQFAARESCVWLREEGANAANWEARALPGEPIKLQGATLQTLTLELRRAGKSCLFCRAGFNNLEPRIRLTFAHRADQGSK